MSGQSWTMVGDVDEAAALMTLGCQLMPSSPVARRIEGSGQEVFNFNFSPSPMVQRVRGLWHDPRLLSGKVQEPMGLIKLAFEHRRRLEEIIRSNGSMTFEYVSQTQPTLPVGDMDCAASLLTLEQRLFSFRPITKESDRDGKEVIIFNFERDDTSAFFAGAWEDASFMPSNPTHILTGLKAAFHNRKLLLDLAARTTPYIHLKKGNWSFMIPKSKDNDGSEKEKLQRLLRAVEGNRGGS